MTYLQRKVGSFLILLFFFIACNTPSSEKGKKIVIWHWMTDRHPAFKELAKRYEEKTGIKINFELYAPSDAYSQKVRAAAQGSSLPDIFGILGEKRDFASFIKAGLIFELTHYMDENSGRWKNSFFSKALAVNEFEEGNSYGIKPGIYGVPIDVMTIQMLYNKSLFKELGLDPDRPPKDFAEFLDIGRKIKAKGMQGLVSGWAEIWMIDCLAGNYAVNIMGEDKVIDTIKGKIPYTDPDWIKVLSLFKQMQEAGLLANSVVTMINKTAEQLFANEKAVFAFNGSWCVNVYKGMNPKLKYAVFLPPKASSNCPMVVRGGAGSSFMVNARSPIKEETVKFLRWFTDTDQQAYLAQTTNNLPANKNSVGKISEILATFAKGMDYATHPNLWGVRESSPVIEAFGRGVQFIIIGKKTPEQVAAEVQRIKEKELAKRR
jgi:ABC-type glycerol-3-phosphate transport system substrate-binding protein